MKKIILKYLLKNALDFGGKANPKAILGSVLKNNPELKNDMKSLMITINEVNEKEVSKLSIEQIKSKLQELAPELLIKEEKKKKIEGPLKELPNAEVNKLVVRIAPSPSGPLHIGHAYGSSLNYEYTKMYKGKFIVRIEDTNPENIYSPAYELIEEDCKWLTDNNVDQVIVQSSRLGIYYDHAEILVNNHKAYVCTCNADKWREMKNKGESCPCRNLEVKENQTRYAKMFGEYAEGESVLRLKTDIKHKNPAMRDFPIMRINEHVHPKTGKKNRVWPLMVFSVAIDDYKLGLTHVLNGKDHADNGKKEALIMSYFGWETPTYKHWGKINFEGFKLSTSKTRIAIEQGEYKSWDDIRLSTLMALRRRGYQSGAFRKYATEIGLSLNDKTVSKKEFWKNINSFNKEIIEPKSNRYFFIDNPVEINIENAIDKKVEIDFHPDFPKKGKRFFELKKDSNGVLEVHISESDLKRLSEDHIHRLMDYCNFEIKNSKWKFVSESYEDYKKSSKQGSIIHWLPTKESSKQKNVNVEVLMEDGNMIKGLGEESMCKLKVGKIIQLERRYFARVDEINQKGNDKIIKLWYLHK